MMQVLFYFILALFFIVIVHEYGHFIVARFFKVKVLRFSFGFGPVLWKKLGKKGTEYRLSLLPLGGYVEMLDERQAEVAPKDQPFAFNRQSVWVRIAIVLAGPLFNFLFAILAFSLILMIGGYEPLPVIDKVIPDSIFAKANIEGKQILISLNEKKIESWRDFSEAILPLLGKEKPLQLQSRDFQTGENKHWTLSLASWQFPADRKASLLDSLGIVPWIPPLPMVIDKVYPSSPAAAAGLQQGDKVIALNEQKITRRKDFVAAIKKLPAQEIQLRIERAGEMKTLSLRTRSQYKASKQAEGYLGILFSQNLAGSEGWSFHRENAFQAIKSAFFNTLESIKTLFVLLGHLLQGKASTDLVSGPIGIAQLAGESASLGVGSYLSFLAFISISIGFLNLLPIPLLDGGHLFYYLIEIIKRRPVSEQAQKWGMFFGLVILGFLMIIGMSNDLSNLDYLRKK